MILFTALSTSTFAQTFQDGLRLKAEHRLPEAAEAFKAIALREPNNAEAISQLATVQGWLQRYDDSIATWQHALRIEPQNAEFHRGLGQVAFWKGDFRLAQTELDTSIRLSPSDADALSLMGDLARARGQSRQAKVFYLKAQERDPGSVELKRKLLSIVVPNRWRIDSGYASDHYDNLRGHEAATDEQIAYKANYQTDLWIQHQYLRHFGFVDNTIEIGAAYRFSKSFVSDANVAFTPHNNFEPEWRTHLGTDYQLQSWIGLTGGLKIAAYDAGRVATFTPGVRVRLTPWAVFSFQDGVGHNLDQTITTNWVARGDFQLRENLALYGGYSRGIEDVPPQRAAFNEVYFSGVILTFSQHWGARMDCAYENRPSFYRRLSISPGVNYRF
jgi:YaiO family outer membrane protein